MPSVNEDLEAAWRVYAEAFKHWQDMIQVWLSGIVLDGENFRRVRKAKEAADLKLLEYFEAFDADQLSRFGGKELENGNA